LPNCERTRWRKKSDFYSLFLTLMRQANLMPFSREGRSALRSGFLSFANEVDAFLSNPDAPGIREEAKSYALAVERAASDLANRRERESRILELMRPVIDAEHL
jgi:hypothetical protein